MAAPFKMVSLQFDDGLLGVFEKAVPILNEVGAVGTVAVVQDFLEDSRDITMNWEHAVAMKNMGWDIQDHTEHHVRVTEQTDKEIVSQLVNMNKRFREMGWDDPEHFYVPFRDINNRVENIVRRYRKYIINLDRDVESLPDLDKLGINYASRRGDTRDDTRQAYIKQTIDEHDEGVYDWVIIRGDDVRDEP